MSKCLHCKGPIGEWGVYDCCSLECFDLADPYWRGRAFERARIIALARARADKSDPSGKASEWLELRWFANELEAEE